MYETATQDNNHACASSYLTVDVSRCGYAKNSYAIKLLIGIGHRSRQCILGRDSADFFHSKYVISHTDCT